VAISTPKWQPATAGSSGKFSRMCIQADIEHGHCSRWCSGQFLVAAASNSPEETDTRWDKQRGEKAPEGNSAKGNPEDNDEEIVSPAM
jgi:hypothetical protein